MALDLLSDEFTCYYYSCMKNKLSIWKLDSKSLYYKLKTGFIQSIYLVWNIVQIQNKPDKFHYFTKFVL